MTAAVTAGGVVITVHDTPRPQGSKKGFVVGKRAVVVDDNKPALRTWREAVKQAAISSRGATLLGPVTIEITFTLPKPVSAPKTRTTWPQSRPDVDKLVRSSLDALTAAGIWKDDAQVIELVARKVYPGEGIDALPQPGAVIRVQAVRS